MHRFCELQTEVGGVNPTTLSSRLTDLESRGIIKKTTYPEVPPRTEYELTPKGKDLVPVLRSMAAWGEKYGSAELNGNQRLTSIIK